jgi:hypothetical protein
MPQQELPRTRISSDSFEISPFHLRPAFPAPFAVASIEEERNPDIMPAPNRRNKEVLVEEGAC